jgi:hypothetical protein
LRRVDRLDFRFPVVIFTSINGVLRRPVEFAQDVPIKYTKRLAEAGVEPSAGSGGDSHDRAGANDQRPLQNRGHSSARTLGADPGDHLKSLSPQHANGSTGSITAGCWSRSLLEPIGNIPPAQAEERYYDMLNLPAMAA